MSEQKKSEKPVEPKVDEKPTAEKPTVEDRLKDVEAKVEKLYQVLGKVLGEGLQALHVLKE